MSDPGLHGERMATAGSRAHDQGASPAGRYGLPPSPGVLKAEQDKNEAMVDDAKMRMLPATELAEMACSFVDQYLQNPNDTDAGTPIAAALALAELAYGIISEKRAVKADHTDPYPYEQPPPAEFSRRHGLSKTELDMCASNRLKPIEYLAAKYFRAGGQRTLFLGAAQNGNGNGGSGSGNLVTAPELAARAADCLKQYIAGYSDPDAWQNLGMALGYLSSWLARYAPAYEGGTAWQNTWY